MTDVIPRPKHGKIWSDSRMEIRSTARWQRVRLQVSKDHCGHPKYESYITYFGKKYWLKDMIKRDMQDLREEEELCQTPFSGSIPLSPTDALLIHRDLREHWVQIFLVSYKPR